MKKNDDMSSKNIGKTVPAGPGKEVTAGRGRGHWRTYGVIDGLASSRLLCK